MPLSIPLSASSCVRPRGVWGRPYFAYDQGVFSSTFAVAEELRPEFHELAREVIEWRLAAYLKREEKL